MRLLTSLFGAQFLLQSLYDTLDLLGDNRVAKGLVRCLESQSIGQALLPCRNRLAPIHVKQLDILEQETTRLGNQRLYRSCGNSFVDDNSLILGLMSPGDYTLLSSAGCRYGFCLTISG